ncbi:MAG TPA: hypothetical protein VMU34_18060 [Mycobacterium sp.]|nr:hypothetical protein [Mycobacterium sp.]
MSVKTTVGHRVWRWNSWNSGITLTEQSVKQVIDAIIASGMRDAGYRYVNLDAGWAHPRAMRADTCKPTPCDSRTG